MTEHTDGQSILNVWKFRVEFQKAHDLLVIVFWILEIVCPNDV
jgi:hypothetical protein